ncbi:MAG: class I SAM-dependent methyltransferase family protein [Methanobrevibacter thaueri]|jgi:tRNA (guanine37-N1)-methyltransferase|uniref:class I SAM-dependent methyltransferase n=1 Tax=Methanobrevibacter thaueri TaxID=190975 RepID=UPI0026ED5DAC|nr:class I SAM-dependent methyltransferase family protein [Methanobrevibacter thaueri]MBE6495538.1 class I SAM-dependent methyltransferase family protein [Methanobrevibacter thaueri]
MKCVKVPLKQLNDTRIKLMENGLMNMEYRIKAGDDYGYIPINEDVDDYEIVDIELEPMKRVPHNFSELLEGELTEEEIENLRTSFDTIGDIVILEIPEDLQDKKFKIGEAALKFTKRRSIYMKKSAIKGTTRVRDLEFLAGVDDSVTIHKEHGARLKLDVREVYFSPRLATERKRVMQSVREGEEILDMFCGIGPFPIVIARNKNVEITSVDINESAIKYLDENIRMNKLKGSITTFTGDVREVSKSFNSKFDRIIMNLPGLAYTFLDVAVDLIKDGGIINYYEFSDSYEQGIKRLKDAANAVGKDVEIINCRKVKSTSPGEWHVAIDGKISKR